MSTTMSKQRIRELVAMCDDTIPDTVSKEIVDNAERAIQPIWAVIWERATDEPSEDSVMALRIPVFLMLALASGRIPQALRYREAMRKSHNINIRAVTAYYEQAITAKESEG